MNNLYTWMINGHLWKGRNVEKTKNKTNISDPWTGSGKRPGRGHGSGLFFVFPWFFVQFGLGGRRCANYKNVYFLRGIVMKISLYE